MANKKIKYGLYTVGVVALIGGAGWMTAPPADKSEVPGWLVEEGLESASDAKDLQDSRMESEAQDRAHATADERAGHGLNLKEEPHLHLHRR